MLPTSVTRFPVDLSLFETTAHTPSLFCLERSMGPESGQLQDYCIPVNSYFPTSEMLRTWECRLHRVLKYYPAYNEHTATTVARCFSWDPDTVVISNGATELLNWISQLFLRKTTVIPVPTFGRWTEVPPLTGKRTVYYRRRAENNFQIDVDDFVRFVHNRSAQAVVLCNPNNPTGAFLPRREVIRLLDALSHLALIVIDESFIDFSDGGPVNSVVNEAVCRENVIVLKSLGKNLGLHGIRVGCSVSNATIAGILRTHLPFWNINAIAEMVLNTLPDHLPQYSQSLRAVTRDRRALESLLSQIPEVRVFRSQANFAFCQLPTDVDGDQLRNQLLTRHGFLVRHCGNKIGSTSSYFRLAARTKRDSRDLVTALQEELLLAVPQSVPIEIRR